MLTAGNDQAIADAINLIRSGGDYQVANEPITPNEFWAAVTQSDWVAITPEQMQKLTSLLGTLTNGIDVANDAIATKLMSMLPADGVSRTNIADLQKRQGSRGERLIAPGFRLTSNDVSEIRNPSS
jgi:hypothetical protein